AHADAGVSESRSVPPLAVRVDPQERLQGALAKLTEVVNELALNTLRPQSCLVGSNNYETAMARSRATFQKEHSGSNYVARVALRKYVTTAMESVGPPVQIAEVIKEFDVPTVPESVVEMLPAALGIDMLV
ncbi:MAG: hypothetical protein HN350_21225, partial [Phycisphaerales bacterium]|nr:hypothetical protein [Phycisphaerales bacterium]